MLVVVTPLPIVMFHFSAFLIAILFTATVFAIGANTNAELGLGHKSSVNLLMKMVGTNAPWGANNVTSACSGGSGSLFLAGGRVYASGIHGAGDSGLTCNLHVIIASMFSRPHAGEGKKGV